MVAEKEEECLNERFQKHFAIRGFNGKFEKFNKIAQDFSKSRKFLKRFWFKRIMVIFFNVLSKFLPKFLYSRLLVAIDGYIDVGDECWRPTVLVTSLRCWRPTQDVVDRFNTLRKSPT